MKKLFAALLAFLMVFTVMPAAFSAAATETPTENGQQPTDNAGVTLDYPGGVRADLYPDEGEFCARSGEGFGDNASKSV